MAHAVGEGPVGDGPVGVDRVDVGRNAEAVVGHDHQHGQFHARAGTPVEAGFEVAFGRAGFAAHNNGDAFIFRRIFQTMAFLHQCCSGSHRILHFDDAGDRNDIPLWHRIMTDEVATPGVPIGPTHGQLPGVVDHGHAHGQQNAGIAVMQVEVIVGGAAAFVYLQTQADVESFFTRATDPEIGFPGFGHFDAAFFQRAGPQHLAEDSQSQLNRHGFAARTDHRGGGGSRGPPPQFIFEIGRLLVRFRHWQYSPALGRLSERGLLAEEPAGF